MRQLLLLLAAAACAVCSCATERVTTFDFSSKAGIRAVNFKGISLTGLKNTSVPLSAENYSQQQGQNVCLTPTNGFNITIRENPGYDHTFTTYIWSPTTKQGILTLKPVNGREVITRIELQGSYGGGFKRMQVNDDTGGYSDDSTVWTGHAKEVSLSARLNNGEYNDEGSGQYRVVSLKSIKVTTEPVTVDAPRFSPPAGSYRSPQAVSITAGDDAEIHYTTDGSTPTEASTQYDSIPILVNTSCTLKAVALYGGYTSEETSAEYHILTTRHVRNVAEFNDQEANEDVYLIFDEPLTAVFQSEGGNYTYATSNKADNMCIYCPTGLVTEYSRDEIINSGIAGIKRMMGDEPVLIPDETTFRKDPAQIHAKLFTTENFQQFKVNDFVYSLSVSMSKEQPGSLSGADADGETFKLTDSYGSIKVINRFHTGNLESGTKVLGIVGIQDGIKVLYPTYATLATDIEPAPETSCIVTARNGAIRIVGNWRSVSVHDMAGRRIAHNQDRIECQPGVYVVVIDGAAQKVTVQ